MLNAVRKACWVLNREGPSGVLNRVRYRHSSTLLQYMGPLPERCFILLGDGTLKPHFQTALHRHNLISRASGRLSAQKIIFNPLPVEFNDTAIAAAVLDDEYLKNIRSEDYEIIGGLTSGCGVIVTSEIGLRKIAELGVELRNVTLVPSATKGSAIRLSIGRWLVYAGLMAPELYLQDMLDHAPPIRSRGCICISLPEYLDRHESFLNADISTRFTMFNGIRMLPGWKGCAWSYKAVAAKALQSGARRLTICEDDAFFSQDFNQYFCAINRYLDRTEWDVFNGVMTRVTGRPEIMKRRKLGENHIIHTPHMMGMVFNVYNRTALEWIADWDPEGGGAETNTIDEWLNKMPGLKVVSAVPFLAGHREEAHSTIFGFKNTRYSGMIRATEREIMAMVNLS